MQRTEMNELRIRATRRMRYVDAISAKRIASGGSIHCYQ